MYILLSSSPHEPVVTLEEPDDCKRFYVAIHGLTEDEVRQTLENKDVGWLSDRATAWIKVAALRRFAQERVQLDWPERFDGMLRFARGKGWLSDDGATVSGHCEWSA